MTLDYDYIDCEVQGCCYEAEELDRCSYHLWQDAIDAARRASEYYNEHSTTRHLVRALCDSLDDMRLAYGDVAMGDLVEALQERMWAHVACGVTPEQERAQHIAEDHHLVIK